MKENDAPTLFDAVPTPDGWNYRLRPADRDPVPSPVVAFLLCAVLAAVGAGFLGFYRIYVRSYPRDWSALSFLAIALIFAAAGSALAVATFKRCVGRDEIRLDAETIRATWRHGRLSWSRVVPRSRLAQLTVVLRARLGHENRVGAEHNYHALAAEDERGRRRTLVAHYPRDLLLALAEDLSWRWKAEWYDPELAAVDAVKPAVGEDSEVLIDVRDRRDPPRGTRLVLERAGDMVRITRPREPLAGPRVMAYLVIGAVTLACAGATFRPAVGPGGQDDPDAAVFVALFLLVMAISALVQAVLELRRREVLVATPGDLTHTHRGLVRTTSKTWRREDIASLRADVKVIEGADGGTIRRRILLRAAWSIGPTFEVAQAEPGATVLLLRRPRRAPAWSFVVVARREGPGPITDPGPFADGDYDYVVRQSTPSGDLGPASAAVAIRVEPEQAEFLDGLSKPELEWVATTLRDLLRVPAVDPVSP